MKKIIALLLALIMTFSCATVAFAAEGTVDTPATEETTAPTEEGTEKGEADLGDFAWILDLPLWTVKPMLKVAKIALKLVKVVVKIGAVFGMEPGDIIEVITNLIENTQNGEDAPAEETTEAPTTAAAVA